jgi:hypothetical protein
MTDLFPEFPVAKGGGGGARFPNLAVVSVVANVAGNDIVCSCGRMLW